MSAYDTAYDPDSLAVRQVAASAALLDFQRPGWRRRIDRDRLDMATSADSTPGQLAEPRVGPDDAYDVMVRALGCRTVDDEIARGFEMSDAATYEVLTELWLAELPAAAAMPIGRAA